MHAPRRILGSYPGLVCRISFGLFALSPLGHAADETITGNLTVNGTISSGGAIDSDSNSQSFGIQSTSTPTIAGSIFTYTDDSMPTGTIDSFKSLLNRSAASWLWLYGPSGGPFVNAMRLDDAHQLLLFKSDGTTAGITFTPQTYTIKLGTHANATLTGNTSTGLITAAGGLTVAGPLTVSGGITNNTGTFGGEPKFDSMPYTAPTALSPTTGSAAFAWGGVYSGTLTGNLTISSFSGTEAAGKKVRFVLVCSGTQTVTFPSSYRAGQTNAPFTTFTPVEGRHVLLFESLDGAGLLLLTDTVFGQVEAASVAVAATPAHYSAASANVEAHLAGIDTALASAGGASVSDAAYNASTWDGVTTTAPSKNAVRDQLELITAGTMAPPQMANFWPTSDLANKPAGWLNAGEGGTPAAATVGGYSMIVKSNGDVAAPTFSPAGGAYVGTQNITLATSTSGAAIRYTVDGSTPTRTTGSIYSTPVSVAATATVKSIAYKDYWADTAVQSATYTISSGYLLSDDLVYASSGAATTAGWSAAQGAPAWNATTGGAPIGSFASSLKVYWDDAAAHAFTASGTIHGYVKVKIPTTPGGTSILVNLQDATTILLKISISTANIVTLGYGSTGAGAEDFAYGALTPGVEYDLWWDYTKGTTGADAVLHAYISTGTGVKGSATATISGGAGTTDATTVLLRSTHDATFIYNKLRISTISIGNNPP